jgi:hypothetical protein
MNTVTDMEMVNHLPCNLRLETPAVANLPSDFPLPVKECYLLGSGVPSWELMKILRLASLGSKQRKVVGYLAAAGQPCSTASELEVIPSSPLHCSSRTDVGFTQRMIPFLLQSMKKVSPAASFVYSIPPYKRSPCKGRILLSDILGRRRPVGFCERI